MSDLEVFDWWTSPGGGRGIFSLDFGVGLGTVFLSHNEMWGKNAVLAQATVRGWDAITGFGCVSKFIIRGFMG